MDAAAKRVTDLARGEQPSIDQACAQGLRVLQEEGAAILQLAQSLETVASPHRVAFGRAVTMLTDCDGSVVVTGIGKAGIVGQKLAATLASTGTRAHFMHAAEAVHGDLGRIGVEDLALVLSFSGETGEILQLLAALQERAVPMVAITGRARSTLAAASSVVLDIQVEREACPLGLAPSTSTTSMLAMSDALALAVSYLKQFQPEDFAQFHPGGSLGRKLARVTDVMRPQSECRLAHANGSLREALVRESRPGRRSGAILVVDDQGVLQGLFTDSDLARLLEQQRDAALDQPIRDVMTAQPITITATARWQEARDLMAGQKISELPVVKGDGRPVGLLDITDVVGQDVHAPRADRAETPDRAVSEHEPPPWILPLRGPRAADQPETHHED